MTNAFAGELVGTWQEMDLGSVIDPSTEKADPRAFGDTPYIGLEHIARDTGTLLGYGRASDVTSTKARFRKGDLLYGKLRPYLNKVCVPDFDGICSTDILVFRENGSVLSAFLKYRFLSDDFVRFSNNSVSGVQHPRTDFNKLARFKILLPPISVQNQLVAILDDLFSRLDAGVAALREAAARAKRYRAAVLKAAVEGRLTERWRAAQATPPEPAATLLERILAERRARWEAEELARMAAKGKAPKDDAWKKKYKEPAPPDTSGLPELPEGWCWGSVEQIGSVSGGLTKNQRREQLPLQLPYLRVANVYAGELRLGDMKKIGLTHEEYTGVRLERGDLLIVEGNGSADQIGRVALWDGSIPECVHQNHIIKVRFNPVSLGSFAQLWLLSMGGRDAIQRVASSTTGLHTLSISKVAALPVPLCSLKEQQVIAETAAQLLANVDNAEWQVATEIQRAHALRQSILKRAFEGRLGGVGALPRSASEPS